MLQHFIFIGLQLTPILLLYCAAWDLGVAWNLGCASECGLEPGICSLDPGIWVCI